MIDIWWVQYQLYISFSYFFVIFLEVSDLLQWTNLATSQFLSAR